VPAPPQHHELAVRGSVEQIYVIHAEPDVEVEVRGPRGFQTSGTTDANGGLLFRDVPAGGGYTVTIAGQDGRFPVTVLARPSTRTSGSTTPRSSTPTRGT
jgi:hypothetical protein